MLAGCWQLIAFLFSVIQSCLCYSSPHLTVTSFTDPGDCWHSKYRLTPADFWTLDGKKWWKVVLGRSELLFVIWSWAALSACRYRMCHHFHCPASCSAIPCVSNTEESCDLFFFIQLLPSISFQPWNEELKKRAVQLPELVFSKVAWLQSHKILHALYLRCRTRITNNRQYGGVPHLNLMR